MLGLDAAGKTSKFLSSSQSDKAAAILVVVWTCWRAYGGRRQEAGSMLEKDAHHES